MIGALLGVALVLARAATVYTQSAFANAGNGGQGGPGVPRSGSVTGGNGVIGGQRSI